MTRHLSAGSLRLDYDDGDLRAIRLGDLEIVRRIYVVFQDRNWTARPWQIEEEDIEESADSFSIRVLARGTFDASHFTWVGEFTGDSSGAIRYAMDGSTIEPFVRNRLGICVLHPMAGFAGRPCTITTVDDEIVETAFPDQISPHQPFLDICCMSYPAGDSVTAHLEFDGETFETEDHRNWSDASYKTYCTPISLPFPVEVSPDDRIEQSVALTLTGDVPPPVTTPDDVTITVSDIPVALPALGTQLTDLPWTQSEIDAIADLGLDHLLVTIDARSPEAGQTLAGAIATAARVGASVRLRLANGNEAFYRQIRETVRAENVASVAVIHDSEKVTSSDSLDSARDILGTDLPWCAGTDLYFTELNRQPADTSHAAWMSFSVNPQVHAADDRTILQNTATFAVIAEDAARLASPARIAIEPISLRPRFNPNAADPSSDVSNTDLPSSVDARQRTWLGAAWTALALRSMSVPGTIAAATFFEALGWRGLRERDAGSVDPAFRSASGERFPVYNLLHDLRGYTDVLPSASDQPEVADALVVEGPDGVRAFFVNMSPEPRTVLLTGATSASITTQPLSQVVVDLPRRTT